MIFVQPFLITFETTLSLILTYVFILSLILSLYSFYPIRREEKWLSRKLSKIDRTYINPPFFFGVRVQDDFALGLLLNTKGVAAVIMLNIDWDRIIFVYYCLLHLIF